MIRIIRDNEVNNKKLVCNIGINDADYPITNNKKVLGKNKQIWICPFYLTWVNMLARCYKLEVMNKQSTYKDCLVCEEWLTFSNFKAWMEQQDWEGKQLDKDLLVIGNKVYGPNTCCFVTRQINNFLTERGKSRGLWPLGVSLHRASGKYLAQVQSLGKATNLGKFDTPEEAHLAWKKAKYALALKLAEEQIDERIAKALIERYKLEE